MNRNFPIIVTVCIAATLGFTAALRWAESQPDFGPCLTTSPGCLHGRYLSLESYQFNSPTSVTMSIRNIGSGTTTLLSYVVRDMQGNSFSSSNWAGRLLLRDGTAAVNIVIDGQEFMFQPGGTYTVEILTSDNRYFMFTITF